MSFTNILESRIDIIFLKILIQSHQNILIATPSPLPLLINLWPKMINEPNMCLKTDKKVNAIQNKKLFASI